jgi:hypothetical protein
MDLSQNQKWNARIAKTAAGCVSTMPIALRKALAPVAAAVLARPVPSATGATMKTRLERGFRTVFDVRRWRN